MASSYLTSTLQGSKLADVSRRIAVEVLRLNADAIAVRGVSGISVGAVVSALTSLPMAVARKEHEDSHGTMFEFSSEVRPERFVIIDDLISTGRTMTAILDKASHHWPNATCVGVVLYWSAIPMYSWNKTGIPIVFVPIDIEVSALDSVL